MPRKKMPSNETVEVALNQRYLARGQRCEMLLQLEKLQEETEKIQKQLDQHERFTLNLYDQYKAFQSGETMSKASRAQLNKAHDRITKLEQEVSGLFNGLAVISFVGIVGAAVLGIVLL